MSTAVVQRSEARRAGLELAVGVGLSGLIEIVRRALKGGNYQFSFFSDPFYYRAMAEHLWRSPRTLSEELPELAPDADLTQVWSHYRGGGFSQYYLHEANGLAHQPQWAYRILEPVVADALHRLGLPLEIGFLLCFLAGGALFVLGMTRLLQPYAGWRRALLVGACALVAGVSMAGFYYPDLLFVGLALCAAACAARWRPVGYVLLAILAAACRETAVLLVVPWVFAAWRHRKPVAWYALALVPLAVLGVIRLLVPVADTSTNLIAIMRTLIIPRVIIATLSAALIIVLSSPFVVRLWQRRSGWRQERDSRAVWSDLLQLVLGVGAALGLSFIATASSRMAFMASFLMLGATGWAYARNKLWLLLPVFGWIGYAALDNLTNSGPLARYSWLLWLAGALGMVALNLVVARLTRDSGADRVTGELAR